MRCRTAARLGILLLCGLGAGTVLAQDGHVRPPHQATGVKVGEVSDSSAIIWTRLTRHARRLDDGAPLPKPKRIPHPKNPKRKIYDPKAPQLPEGVTIDQVEGAVPGAPGQVRLLYGEQGREAERKQTEWVTVDAAHDFVHQFALRDLKPDTEYTFQVECRANGNAPSGPSVHGRFRTAPDRESPGRIVFTVVTGQMYWHQDCEEGYKIYPAMAALNPSFFVHTGDIIYYDAQRPVVKNVAMARYHWHRMYSLPSLVAFHREVPSYFIKDDHDTWCDDCWPTMKTGRMGEFTFEQGLGVFGEQVPMGDLTYRTIRWGKDLQVWLVEGRDYRSPNTMPDGPDKTIWGKTQKEWLKRTVSESDATFKVLISPTPIVGPDRPKKRDNHSNAVFAHEGNEVRRWIRDSGPNMVVVCGDRHWQYVSIDPDTGIREYSCGPASDVHAGGFPGKDDKFHTYFGKCGGFLAGIVERVDNTPTLTFRHYSVDGKILFEDALKRK